MAKQVFFRRRNACPFSGEDGLKIDYKDVKLLSRYISEKGKIIPSRITAVSAKKQLSPICGAVPLSSFIIAIFLFFCYMWNLFCKCSKNVPLTYIVHHLFCPCSSS